MENDFDLENRENFKINPEVWLHTLLAIAGDKEKKEEVVEMIADKTGYLPEQVEVILATTISVLINQTRAN
ncbi:MAG TPA: hypothetical protein VK206_28440 [Anaerolineales bacterium]|nr:hypothetical protein [Anaerolineales bacterium]HLO34070.1 hypothetical protein [Anaerolineales bacterium]